MEQNNVICNVEKNKVLLENWEKALQRTVDGKRGWKIMPLGKIRTKFRNHDYLQEILKGGSELENNSVSGIEQTLTFCLK